METSDWRLKEHILREVSAELSQGGIEKLKLKNIAENVGIPRATFYRLFKNKNEVFIFTVSYIFDLIEFQYHKETLNENLLVSEKLGKVSEAIVQGVLGEREVIAALLLFWYESKENQRLVKEQLRRRYFIVYRLFSNLLIEGSEKGELALERDNISIHSRILVTMITALIIRSARETNFLLENSLFALQVYIKGLEKV